MSIKVKEDVINSRIKKSLLVGSALVAVGGATAGTIGIASAATNSSNGQASLVDKIAEKFGLKKDDVQKVFDEDRSARESEHVAQAKDRLDQLVKDGKLTQDQADKLTAKAKELKAERDANKDEFKNMSDSERKTAMDKKRDELTKWLKDNGIDQKYAMFIIFGHGGPDGHGGPKGMGPMMDGMRP